MKIMFMLHPSPVDCPLTTNPSDCLGKLTAAAGKAGKARTAVAARYFLCDFHKCQVVVVVAATVSAR